MRSVNERIYNVLIEKFSQCYKKNCPPENIRECLTKFLKDIENQTGFYIVDEETKQKAVGIGDIIIARFLDSKISQCSINFEWEDIP